MKYEARVAQLLEEIVAEFDFDPAVQEYTIESPDGPAMVNPDLSDLISEANDLLYGTEEEDEDVDWELH